MRIPVLTSAALLLLAPAAFAQDGENSVIIDQVGPGSVNVQQSGAENSLEIHQGGNAASMNVNSVQPQATTDYQSNILSNPYTSPLARTQELPAQPETLAKPKPADKKADEKKVDDSKKLTDDSKKLTEDTKKLDEKSGNSIRIKQSGDHNKAATSQTGSANKLDVDQQGGKNEVHRTQTGKHNSSHITQNGEVIEDNQDE